MNRGTGFLFCVATASAATAQPIDTSPLVIDRDRADRVQPTAPMARERDRKRDTNSLAAVSAVDDEAAAPIQGIRFEGGKVPAPVARAAETFIGKPARKAVLEQLAKAMSDAYATTSVALYTVLVPTQDVRQGDIKIIVAEGFIEATTITGDVEAHSVDLIKAYAKRLSAERPLTRATLQRYLSLIRDVPGLTVDAQLLVGTVPGGVRLVLALKHRNHEFAAGFNNRTSQLVGGGQFDATAKFYSVLREGDETAFSASSAIDFNDYRYISASHSTPIGADGMRASVVGAYLTSRPRHSPIRGNAKLAGATVSYPVIRSYTRNLTVSGGLDGLNSDNAAFGSLIASERTRALRVAAGYSDQGPHHLLSGGITASRGVDILGARVIEPLAQVEFSKLNLRASLDRSIGKSIIVRLRTSGQLTKDRLPAAERFAVGGGEFGRAFEAAIFSADRGVAGLAELAWRPLYLPTLRESELYAFVDGAKVHFVQRGPIAASDFDLASAGTGIRFAYRDKAALELEAAHSIDRPYPGYQGDWRFSVGWKLSLKK